MPSDLSRRVDDPRYGYTGVVGQQGRVILDRDFNALQGLTADRIQADALDFVGPCGTPDDGFRISLPVTSPPGPPLWSPPAGWPGSPPDSSGDFWISPGTMYVGGQRVEFPAEQNGKTVTYTYLDQPDWPAPPLPTSKPDYELVFLELTELEVSAVEDPDLLEVALGGPDTTQRLKLLRRVHRMSVNAISCAAAWAEATRNWAAEGWAFDAATMQLLPQARLKVGFTQTASTSNPCDPVATGGYLGADNQLIRVRIANSGSQTQLLWSYDNASFLYRVATVSPDGTTLTLASNPPDGFHVPQTGQMVEVLSTAAVFAEEPDETDPTGKSQILRVAAAPGGTLRQLAQPYGPSITGDPTNYLVLDTALPAELARSPLPLFVRVWQAALPLTVGSPVTITDPTTGNSTGVTATISLAAGSKLPGGAYWQIAVRPSTPQGVYPEDLLNAPQPPDGLRRWACPLALIDWTSGQITDCRSSFQNLVALSRRKPGCCTVSIGPSDVTAVRPLQTLIDDAVAQAATVTICLAGGSYPLTSPLRLDARHADMTLESCGGIVQLSANSKVSTSLFVDGLVVLTNATNVTLRNLTILPPQSAVSSKLVDDLLTIAARDEGNASAVFGKAFVSFGVRVLNSENLTLDGCTIALTVPRADATSDLFAAALFLQGACAGLKVYDCTFSSTIQRTYTDLSALITATPSVQLAPAKQDDFTKAFNFLKTSQSLTSPPPTPQLQIDDQVQATFDVMVAKRLAVNPSTPTGVVATAGVIAAPHSGIADGSPGFFCGLGEATIRDSSFTGLTFGISISAASTSLRVQDNTISGGVAGLWVLAPLTVAPINPAQGSAAYYPQCAVFEESLLATVLATTATPPVDPSPPADPPKQTSTTLYSLFVVGNEVKTQPNTANMALYLSLNTLAVLDTQVQAPVIISGNHLSSTAGLDIPAALLTLAEYQPCAITGNAILNLWSGDSLGPSLWAIVSQSATAAPLLSISGNVLYGSSDITVIPHAGVTLGWSTYNAFQP